MTDRIIEIKTNITDINVETYMQHYAEQSFEWVEGRLINLSPVSSVHDKLCRFLGTMLEFYLEQTGEGEIRQQPFVMIPYDNSRTRREPDIMVITKANLKNLKATFMDGAADIVIEIVSPESIDRDYKVKLAEYEKAGVREYWIVDPLEKTTRFYVRDENGKFKKHSPDKSGIYISKVLPNFQFKADILHSDPVPGMTEAFKIVSQLLEKDK